MSLLSAFLFFAASAVAIAADGVPASLPPRSEAADGLAAFVNGEPISIGDVVREMPRWLKEEVEAAPRGADPARIRAAAFRKALSALEDKALVLQRYKALEMRIPPHAVDRAAASILENRFDGNRQALLADLAARKLSWEEWRNGLEEEIIVASMKNLYADGNAAVSPNEVSVAYERLKASRYRTPAKVRVRVAALPDDETAAEFLARLRAGESFEALARGLSADARAENGGDCGLVVPEDEFAPAICEALGKLGEGEVSEPVPIGAKRYVVKRGESVPAGERPLAEVWDELRDELLANRKEELFKAWIGHLREASDIRETVPFAENAP